jgi:hypothetical protein
MRATVGAALGGRPRFPHCVSALGQPAVAAPTVSCWKFMVSSRLLLTVYCRREYPFGRIYKAAAG